MSAWHKAPEVGHRQIASFLVALCGGGAAIAFKDAGGLQPALGWLVGGLLFFGGAWYGTRSAFNRSIFAGFLMNAIVIVLNSGYMPVADRFWEAGEAPSGIHARLTSASRLPFLADVLPGGLSAGDYVCFAGFLTLGRSIIKQVRATKVKP